MVKKKQKKSRKPKVAPQAKNTHHWYRHGQQPNQWIVPLTADDLPVILHAHAEPDDHSGCGPQLFCCGRALALYLEYYRDLLPEDVCFQFGTGSEVADWYRSMTPPLIYFYACDPVNQQRAYFLSVMEQHAWDIIQFFVPIETVLVGAEVIV